jgi:hypothetical protein
MKMSPPPIIIAFGAGERMRKAPGGFLGTIFFKIYILKIASCFIFCQTGSYSASWRSYKKY